MAEARTLGVIPARLGSERLARKPLHVIAGRPLLEWVWRRVSGFKSLDRVVIATDAEEIVAACRTWGAAVELTGAQHRSGTERIGELVGRPEYAGYDIVVNVQGDEPFVQEAHVEEAIAQVRNGFDIGTVGAPVGSLEAWLDPGVVKVTRRIDGAALYFSRSPIPFQRAGTPTPEALRREPYLRHIGLYAYRPEVLRRWQMLPESELESIERLEQLRALSAGLRVGVGVVAEAEGGVDTAADAARAERRLRSETPG
ncbi:MAG TPA: 3-deoxy-manno-octulosonate cytidylyltransferase [Longimicrobiales bacterium]